MPARDDALRAKLLDFFLETAPGPALSDWLRDIGQSTQGTVADKRQRIRQHTAFLSTPVEEFPERLVGYLDPYTSDGLADLCEVLELDDEGTRDTRYRRVMREVGFREGWLQKPLDSERKEPKLATVRPFVQWYPIVKRGAHEADYYDAFAEEMEEVFDESVVHGQLPIAYGSSLKIDFHIGHPQQGGVGVEFKRPKTNSELQRALGQVQQYKTRYGDQLLIVLVPDDIEKAQKTLFLDSCKLAGIDVVVKEAA
jgi:hypothetical protein